MEIRFKKLREEAELPIRADKGSVGLDIKACLYEEETGEKITKVVVPVGGTVKITTGLACQLPEGHFMIIAPRSSVGVKKGLMLKNTVGIIDESYRGQIYLFFKNISDEPVVIENGERVAQAIVLPYPVLDLVAVNELDNTERGAGGFGSTNMDKNGNRVL